MSDQDNIHWWLLPCYTEEQRRSAKLALDEVFVAYSFYPEIEWAQYGYRPPEGFEIYGAWRHPTSIIFCFLLSDLHFEKDNPRSDFMLYAAGAPDEISRISSDVKTLKGRLVQETNEPEVEIYFQRKLKRIQSLSPLKVAIGLLALFTPITKAISNYLTKFPMPDFESKTVITLYRTILAVVHFMPLLLFTLIVVMVIILILKYISMTRKL